MADKKTLTGRVVDQIGDEFTTVRVRHPGADARPFFITDNNASVQKTLLAVVKDRPFALDVTSSGPRGFIASLTVASRPRPGADIEQQTVATTHNFDPASLDTKGSVTFDRWSGDGRASGMAARALVAGSQEAAARDGEFVDAATRSILSLHVSPLITVEAGGIEWRGDGPKAAPADFDTIAALMRKYAPSQVLKGVTVADLSTIVASTAALASTDELFEVAWDQGPAPAAHFAAHLSNLESEAGPTARYGHLVHGSALPEIAGARPIKATSVGGYATFEFCLFACPTVDDLNGFRSRVTAGS